MDTGTPSSETGKKARFRPSEKASGLGCAVLYVFFVGVPVLLMIIGEVMTPLVGLGTLLFFGGLAGLVRPQWIRVRNRWFAGVVAIVGLFITAAFNSDQPTNIRIVDSSDQDGEESRPFPRNAADDFERLRYNASLANNAQYSLRMARSIVEQYPGTPEADSAAAMIADLELLATEQAQHRAEAAQEMRGRIETESANTARKKEIFAKVVESHDKAQAEADMLFPIEASHPNWRENIDKNIDEYRAREARYIERIKREYGIDDKTLNSIKVEGARERWPPM